MEKNESLFGRGLVLASVVLLMTFFCPSIKVDAKDVSLVKGESVSYMGYSTHYYYVNGKLAFCLEPDKNSPGNGVYGAETLDGDTFLGKAMYYVYGGPGYETYMKPSLTGGWDRDDRAYCLSHCILSYIYDGCDSQSAAFIGLNEDIKSAVVMYADAIRTWPEIPDTDISLSETELVAYFSPQERCQRTQSITCNGDRSNSLVFPLPEGVTLVNETKGTKQDGEVSVSGGDTFYLASDVAYGNGTMWESGEIRGTLNQAWRTLIVKTGEGSQDMGSGEVITVEADPLSLRAIWLPKPELTVSKCADKPDKTYQLGDIITYTMDVTQQIHNAVAKHVVITDTILTEGVKLQKNSIVLLDANQCIVSDAIIDVTGNSYTIQAGEFLRDIELGEKYTVEYQVAITDESVIGKEIVNEVVVRADNAEEVKTQEKVIVEEPEDPKPGDETPKEPEISKPEKPQKVVENKPVKAATVKTGDEQNMSILMLLLILSCTVIITCGRMNAWRRAKKH